MDTTFTIDQTIARQATARYGKITESGVYAVKIEHAYLGNNTNNIVLNLQVRTSGGSVGFINALGVKPLWASGAVNNGYAMNMALMALCGVQQPQIVEVTRSKNGKQIKALEVANLIGKQCMVAVRCLKEDDQVRLRLVEAYGVDGVTLSGDTEAIKIASKNLAADYTSWEFV